MKHVIILEKTGEKENLSEGPTGTTTPAEMAQALSFVDLVWRYKWAISKADIETAKELGLTEVKNYSRRAGKVEMKLDWLYDWILALAIFVRHSRRVYNNKEVG